MPSDLSGWFVEEVEAAFCSFPMRRPAPDRARTSMVRMRTAGIAALAGFYLMPVEGQLPANVYRLERAATRGVHRAVRIHR